MNKGEVGKVQGGVFRTNCIDCLDRTNVVQSMIAKHLLHQQLRVSGMLWVVCGGMLWVLCGGMLWVVFGGMREYMEGNG